MDADKISKIEKRNECDLLLISKTNRYSIFWKLLSFQENDRAAEVLEGKPAIPPKFTKDEL